MLERLKRRTPLSVQRDDLTVDHRQVGLQPRACPRDSRIHPGEVLVLPGPELDALLVLDDQRPVAVELQLVGPVVALGPALDDLRGHRRDERRACPRRCRAASLRWWPSLLLLVRHGHRRTTDVLPRLVRHLHVELDRRELIGRLADLAQEWQPAWSVLEIGEQGL